MRLGALQLAGGDAAEAQREVLELRRQLREGGQLRAGDRLACAVRGGEPSHGGASAGVLPVSTGRAGEELREGDRASCREAQMSRG